MSFVFLVDKKCGSAGPEVFSGAVSAAAVARVWLQDVTAWGGAHVIP